MNSIRPTWGDIKPLYDCPEHRVEVRRRVYASGQISYWTQCVICGHEARQLRLTEIPAGAKSTPDFPAYNEALKQAHIDKISMAVRTAQDAFDEHQAQAKRASYTEYLQSTEWAKRRAKVLRRANGVCEACGEPTTRFHVHHKTYANLGHEPLWDLAAVCVPCHESIHPHMGAA